MINFVHKFLVFLPTKNGKKKVDLVPSKDMQTPPSPAVLRSGHLDIKDAQYAVTKDVLKKSSHHIALLCYGRPKDPKRCAIN